MLDQPDMDEVMGDFVAYCTWRAASPTDAQDAAGDENAKPLERG
jgi:hypothetical protein